MVLLGLAGAGAAQPIVNHQDSSHHDTDDRLGGAAIGAVTGATLGYFLCGEGGRVQVPMTAQIRATPRTGETPLNVSLNAMVTPDDAKISRYEWDLGDGTKAIGPTVSHTYSKAESFDVRLMVTDAKGETHTATTRIDARQPRPEPQVEAAPPRRRIVLRGITFPFDSAAVSPAEAQVLDVAVEQLKGDPRVRVKIVGHTDSKGSDEYNQKLSERRARAVRDYFVKKGLDIGRFDVEGRGESQPLASNSTSDGRAQNRRVELDILQ